jgi:hypothetical protein
VPPSTAQRLGLPSDLNEWDFFRALAHGLDLVRKSIARSLTNTFSGSTGRQDHEFCTDANIGTRSIPIESGPGSDEAMEEGREQEANLA